MTEPLSTARTYFQYIKSQPDPFAFLSNITSPPRPEPFFEEEWIDFKGEPRDDNDAKRIWSKALSGYANITDGLVVWGIDARKTAPRDIDAASALRLIADPHAFESKLRDWIRDATNPPVMGVEYQSYPGPGGAGFVICLIPESSHKPHRAEFANKHFYYRAGDDFLIAEPGLLRVLFYPQTRPYISTEVTLEFRLNPRDIYNDYKNNPSVSAFNKLLNARSSMYIDVKLQNSGTATAKDVYLVLQSNHELIPRHNSDWNIHRDLQREYAFRASRPFHPKEVAEVLHISFKESFYNRTGNTKESWEIIPHFDKVSLRFFIYHDNAQPQELVVEFVPEDLNYDTASATKTALPTT